ncbi:hypothetical protein EZV61_17020 [Corallincola luteus]|uniref:Uncharacterized protein n=1 Tax=Corallincola luteus TaxID=1775177 RepID=A0ABY2AGL8_9GAMM|nr:hypothetical protein [Corallincola luteus]TCI01673.1 hypothetical protein EZV61_17020 [Corallincola luteus]
MKNTRIPLVLLATVFAASVANAEPAVQRYEVVLHQEQVRDVVRVQTEQTLLEMDYQLDKDVIVQSKRAIAEVIEQQTEIALVELDDQLAQDVFVQSSDALSDMSDDPGLQPYAIAEAMEQHPERFTALHRPATTVE